MLPTWDKSASGGTAKNGNMSNQLPLNLTEEIHKPIIWTFQKQKVYSPFIDNIWGADLVNMELTIQNYKGVGFLLCVIDIFSKLAWVIPLKDEKGITVTNAFQNILN